jgi:hypothetical protein
VFLIGSWPSPLHEREQGGESIPVGQPGGIDGLFQFRRRPGFAAEEEIVKGSEGVGQLIGWVFLLGAAHGTDPYSPSSMRS